MIEEVVQRAENIEKVWLKGSFTLGKDNPVIELVIMGNDIDTVYFTSLIKKVKELIKRDVDYSLVSSFEEALSVIGHEKTLLIWKK